MTAAKEIRNKIKSIRNTQKITSTMEKISASKMRKAEQRMSASKPYAEKINTVISHLALSHSEYRHSYMDHRPVQRVGFIIVSTDRGLCGGLNANLFRQSLKKLKAWKEQGVEVDLCLIGKKAQAFFNRFGGRIVAVAEHLGDKPNIYDLIGIVRVLLDSYEEKNIDALHIGYNQFINTMVQKPWIHQLLPLKASDDKELKHHWDYIYEPDAKELLDRLFTRYMESQVYQGVVENVACEQAARMIAMKNATDNAGDLINKFQIAYNKARQAAITQEIAEIVGGAAAV